MNQEEEQTTMQSAARSATDQVGAQISLHEVEETAKSLQAGDKPGVLKKLLNYLGLGFSVAALVLLAHQHFQFESRLAEVQAITSTNLVAMIQKQRSLVAGAAVIGEPSRVEIAAPEGVPRLGKAEAKVELIEFSDFQCPFCGKFFHEVLPQLKSEYIDTGKASFVYQNFAFLGEESTLAAQGSICAKEQDKFWEYHDVLFNSQNGENQGTFNNKKLEQMAAKIKMDTKSFRACLESGKYKEQVSAEQAFGREKGVSGTPTLFVNGTRIVGALSFENYKLAIEKALAE